MFIAQVPGKVVLHLRSSFIYLQYLEGCQDSNPALSSDCRCTSSTPTSYRPLPSLKKTAHEPFQSDIPDRDIYINILYIKKDIYINIYREMWWHLSSSSKRPQHHTALTQCATLYTPLERFFKTIYFAIEITILTLLGEIYWKGQPINKRIYSRIFEV